MKGEFYTNDKILQYHFYPTFINRVIDGDTFSVTVDLGFHLTLKATIRLSGINTPEITGEQRAEGLKSKEAVKDLIEGKTVFFKSENKTDKYGRWLGQIITEDGINLGEWILANEMGEVMILAVPKKESWWKRFLRILGF